MLAGLLFATSLQQPKLPSFTDILKEMHGAYRKLSGFHEEWRSRWEDHDLKFLERTIDGNRYHMVVTSPEGPMLEAAYDGNTQYTIVHPAKVYGIKNQDAIEFKELFKLEKPPHHDNDSVSLNAPNGFGFFMWFEPWPEVKRIEPVTIEGKPMRIVHSDWRPKPDKVVQVRLTFEEKDWILQKAEVEGKDREGKQQYISWTGKIVRDGKYKSGPFKPDPKSYDGYQKVDFGGGGVDSWIHLPTGSWTREPR